MLEAPVGVSAHVDTFTRDHLPPPSTWPQMDYSVLPQLAAYPSQINCAAELLDKQVARLGSRPLLYFGDQVWSYQDLREKADRIANVLVEDFNLQPGNRVLLRASNNPMLVACWFAAVKAGAVVVATMPLLRWRELTYIADKAEVGLAVCDARLREEMELALAESKTLQQLLFFNSDDPDSLEARMAAKPPRFEAVDTAADDVCLIAFTSGTTGLPKGTMHFHRDVMAACDCFPRSTLKPRADDIFCGSPPIAFTFGLGGLVLFPMRFGASTALLERPAPEALLETIHRYRATILVTAPTAYRTMLSMAGKFDLSSLRKCVSAGEKLPLSTFEAWRQVTGIRIIDGLGTTEMLHIFLSAAGDQIRPGASGKPIRGYQAQVVGENLEPLPAGEVGRLAVRGPTGCRYLADERQTSYVVDGWNLTGDAYSVDEDGYFWFQARADDMIISSGYNISGPEVEEALLAHRAVEECAVVGAPDAQRGNIVKAFVVLRPGMEGDATLVQELQEFVKQRIAPYKYPRAIDFVDALPRTPTGKVQRAKLRQQELDRVGE
ncbi:MAG: benzoate-CoA ligase family protein [Acidobacteriota bacterium]